jgi:hypothetical protein
MKEEKTIYDFTNLQVEFEIDKFETRDVSKTLGNIIHQNTSDIGIDEMARKIYKDGKVSLTENEVNFIVAVVKNSNLIISYKTAITIYLTTPQK